MVSNTIIYVVDAFTGEIFKGNPAGVCILNEAKADNWMQNIAAEMNLSETAFIHPASDGYSLRWFTPDAEVELCGHATLASAHILWELGCLSPDEQIRFYTRSGLLTAIKNGEMISLNFPAEEARQVSCPDKLNEALQVDPIFVGKNRFDYLVEIASEEALKVLAPNFAMLGTIPARGVIVTSKSKEYDFISRCFFPALGVNEDPVTGSAHCCLGPYWSVKLNKGRLYAFQASKRGGTLQVTVAQDRVILSGQAVTVLRSELMRIAEV